VTPVSATVRPVASATSLAAGAHRIANVRDLQVLVKIDKLLPLRMRENGPAEILPICGRRRGVTGNRADQFECVRQTVDRERRVLVIIVKLRPGLAG
jgi:hypothetical protein